MLDIGQRHNVEISIEHLSLNFDKLEDMHYGLLKKMQQEKGIKKHLKDVIPSSTSPSSELVKGSSDNEFDRLQALKTAFNQETQNLKRLLNASLTNNRPLTDTETFKICYDQVESTVKSLKDRILASPELKDAGRSLPTRVHSYFDLASQDINLAFSYIRPNKDKGGLDIDSVEKIVDLCHMNSETFNNIGNLSFSLKKKVVASVNELRTCEVSYTREAEAFKANFDQIKTQLKELEQSSNDKAQNTIRTIVSLLNNSLTIEAEKTKWFNAAKAQAENTFKKIMNQLKDIMTKVEASGSNTKALGSIIAQEKCTEDDIMTHQVVVTPSLERRNMSMQISSAHTPDISVDLFKRRNHSPSSKLLVDTVPKLSMSPIRQNFFTPISTSRKSFINGNSPLRSTRVSPRNIKEDEQLRKYVGTMNRMKDDLRDCSKNLLRAVNRVIEPVIQGQRANKFVLHTFQESQKAFDKLIKELEGVTYQGKFIYPFGYFPNRRPSTESLDKVLKQTFRSQSPTRKEYFSSASAKDLANRTTLDGHHVLVNKTELLLWKTEERRRNLEEVYSVLLDKDSGLKSAGTKLEGENDLSQAMEKVEKLLQLVESQFERKYTALYAKLGQKEYKLECLEQELTKLMSQKGTVHSQPIENEQKVSKFAEEKYNALAKEYENSQDKNRVLEESYQIQIQALNNKIAQLNKLNEQIEANHKMETSKTQDHSQDALTNKVREVEAKIRLEEEEKLNKARQELQEALKKQIESHDDQIRTFNAQINSLNAEKDLLQKDFEEKQKQILALATEIDSIKDSQADAFNNEQETYKKSLEEKQKQILALTTEIDSIKYSYTTQIDTLTNEKETHKKGLEEKQKQILALTMEIDSIKNSSATEIDALTAKQEIYKKNLEEKQSQVNEHSKEIEALEKLVVQLETELEQTKSDLEEATVHAEEQADKIAASTREKEELQAHLEVLEDTIINKQEEIVELREAYESTNLKLQKDLTGNAAVLLQERDESRQQNSENQKRIKVLEQEIKDLKEKNQILSEETEKLIEVQANKSKETSAEMDELKKELEICRDDIEKLNAEVETLREQNEKLLDEIESIKQRSVEQDEEIIDLKNKLAQSEKEFSLAVSRYEEDIKDERLQEKDQINKLKSQLIEKDETHQTIVEKFEGEVAELKIRLNKMLSNENNESQTSPAFKNPFEAFKEESLCESEQLASDPRSSQKSAAFNHEKTAFSLAGSVVSFEYQTQQGESNMFDKKAQFSAFGGDNKLRLNALLDNNRIEEESTPQSKSVNTQLNEGVVADEADVRDSSDGISEARDQVRLDQYFGVSGVSKPEKTAFSMAGSVVSFEYLTQQGESAMLDAKRAQFSTFGEPLKFDYEISSISNKMKEELKNLQDQIDGLKKEKAVLQEEYDKYLKYKEDNSSIEQMQSEIRELKAFLTQKDIEISNFKMISSRASVDADKVRGEYEKRIFDLGEEIKELKDRRVHVEKSQELQQNQEQALKKMSTADFKKEFESFEFSEMNPWKQSQADFSQASFSESQVNVEKYKKDNKRLREERRHLRDENEELRASVKTFQEQIVNLSEFQKSNAPAKDENTDIVKTLKESFAEICAMEILKDRVPVKFANHKEAKETFEALKKVLKENEEDMMELVKELEEYDKSHHELQITKERLKQREEEMIKKVADANVILQEGRKRIQEEVDLVEGDINERMLRLNKELEAILQDYMIADVDSEHLKADGEDGLEKTEKMMVNYLTVIREYIEVAAQVQDNYEKLLAETQEKEQKDTQPNQLGQSIVKKDDDEEEEKKDTLEVPNVLKKNVLKRENTMDQIRKFLPRSSISESVTPVNGEDTVMPTFQDIVDKPVNIATVNDVGNQEHVRSLYDQIRALQDENEKLQEDAKQVDHEFTMLKFTRDDLKAELLEKDDLIKELEIKLDKAIADLEKNNEKTQLKMEKDHIKSIFVKFMQSATNGQKDAAFELLRMLMSLLQLSEEDQRWITDIFKKKSAKKGVFGKLFK